MSVVPGEIRQRYDQNRGNAEAGRVSGGFNSPGGDIPRQDYWYQPGTSKAARGSEEINLNYEGLSLDKQSLDLMHKTSTQYPQGYVRVSGTGDPTTSHAVVYDDTRGGERICYRHSSGSGVDMKPDGSIVIVSRNNKVDLTTGNHHVIVEANGTMIYRGDVNMKIEGDYNLDVGGNYNIKVGGNWNLNVLGAYSKRVIGAFIESIGKGKFVTVLGDLTQTLLGKVSESIKGNHSLIVKGEGDYNYGQDVVVTSEVEVSLSAPSINAVAQDVTVTGNTGTIGGENIVMYNYNMYTGHSINALDTVTTKSMYATDTLDTQTINSTRVNSTSMHATTFHGDLTGIADQAIASDTAVFASRGGGPGAPDGWTNVNTTADAVDATAANTTKGPKKWPTDAASDWGPTGRDDQKPVPTEVTTKLWLENGVAMIQPVTVDDDDGIKNDQNLTNSTAGVTDRPLTVDEVRTKLRVKANRNNTAFTQKMIEQECLDPSYTQTTPDHVGRIISDKPQARLGQTIIGQKDVALTNIRYKPADTRQKTQVKIVLPESQYNPNSFSKVTMGTLIGKGWPISKFMDEGQNLNHLDLVQRKQLARNLTAMVKILQIAKIPAFMKGYNPVVKFGVAKINDNEHPPVNSFSDFASTGRAIGFEVVNSATGEMSLDATYDLVCYLKDNCEYRKLVLAYDTMGPSGNEKGKNAALHALILVSIPEIPEDFKASFKMKIATSHNYEVQSNSDFVESLEEEAITLPESNPKEPEITVEGLVDVKTKKGYTAKVAQPVYDKFQNFVNDLEATGYTIENISGYSRTKQSYGKDYKGTDIWSAQASGLAIIIDPHKNTSGSGKKPPKNILSGGVAKIAQKYGIVWGGSGSVGFKNTAHFSALYADGGSIKHPRSNKVYKTSASEEKIKKAVEKKTSPPVSSGYEFISMKEDIEYFKAYEYSHLPEWDYLGYLDRVENSQYPAGTQFKVIDLHQTPNFRIYQVWQGFYSGEKQNMWGLVEITDPDDVKRREQMAKDMAIAFRWLKS